MMYNQKMALAVKANGRVLRENKDTVYLPFGCEYSLLLKNLNSLRAIAHVWIDGVDVMAGTGGLIVEPNNSVDLERFIQNGNLSKGNKFKFIERTQAVSNHRGNKIDDGLIRVEFEFEQRATIYDKFLNNPNWYTTTTHYYGNASSSGISGSLGDTHSYTSNSSGLRASGSSGSPARAFVNQVASNGPVANAGVQQSAANASTQSETGITVAGAVSDQKFSMGAWFPTDGVKHVMVLQMLGEVEGQQVVAPVTVKHKPQCSSCGKVNKANAKFCSECGTGLLLVDNFAQA
jgi:hypothetical protein